MNMMASAASPVRPTGPQVRPTGWWYAATIGLFLVAVGVAVLLLAGGVREARNTGREATRVVIGQDATLTFDESQSLTLYLVGPVQIMDESQIPQLIDDLGVSVRSQASGAELALAPYDSNDFMSRDSSGFQQVALLTFRVEQAGDYTISSRLLSGFTEFDAQLVVTPSPFRPLARRAILALTVLALGAIASLIATITLAVNRGRSKRASRAAVWGPSSVAPRPFIIPPPPPGYGPADTDSSPF